MTVLFSVPLVPKDTRKQLAVTVCVCFEVFYTPDSKDACTQRRLITESGPCRQTYDKQLHR